MVSVLPLHRPQRWRSMFEHGRIFRRSDHLFLFTEGHAVPTSIVSVQGRYTATARLDSRDHTIRVEMRFTVRDWKRDVHGPMVVAVEGLGGHAMTIGVHISFGVEESWGSGDVDYGDVTLSVMLALQGPHGEEILTRLQAAADGVSCGKGGWKAEPARRVASAHSFSGSVAGCFSPVLRFVLKPVG